MALPHTPSALVYEREALVAERARQMLSAEGFATCLVDDVALFHEVNARAPFDLYVFGVNDDEAALPELAGLQPLVLLAPLGKRAAHLRMAIPHAELVDRALRDPDALRAVAGGPPESAAPEADAVRRAFSPFGLSERQLEVLGGALLGETSREIAKKLFISELTVRNHLHAIYERVGVSGRRELLGRFVQGLIEGHA